MFNAQVCVIGGDFCWSFPSNHTVPFATVRAALTQCGFPDRECRQLCSRHAFLRAIREWLRKQNGGSVDHTISDVLDSRVVETKDLLRIQIDDKIINQTVNFKTRCQLSVDKSTGAVWSDCPTLQAEISLILPAMQDGKKSTDLNNLVHRLFRNANPFALIPAVGLRANGSTFRRRGVYFVPEAYRTVANQIETFIRLIGGDCERNDLYSFSPIVTPATPSNPTPPAPVSLPTNGQTNVVVRSIFDHIHELAEKIAESVTEIHQREWKGTAPRAKRIREAYADCLILTNELETAEEAYGIRSLPYEFGHTKAILEDWIAGIRHALQRVEAGQPLVLPVDPTLPQTTVSYIADETDEISEIELVSENLVA